MRQFNYFGNQEWLSLAFIGKTVLNRSLRHHIRCKKLGFAIERLLKVLLSRLKKPCYLNNFRKKHKQERFFPHTQIDQLL
jgi:hypothetical protein